MTCANPAPDRLWAVHVKGPDDIIAASDLEHALEYVETINAAMRGAMSDAEAVLIEWPYSPAAHAAELRCRQNNAKHPGDPCLLCPGSCDVCKAHGEAFAAASLREAVAELIYGAMIEAAGVQYPWVPRGNSTNQDAARSYAEKVIARVCADKVIARTKTEAAR